MDLQSDTIQQQELNLDEDINVDAIPARDRGKLMRMVYDLNSLCKRAVWSASAKVRGRLGAKPGAQELVLLPLTNGFSLDHKNKALVVQRGVTRRQGIRPD